MLRVRISDELKIAMKAKDEIRVSTIRLINAALKDRDIQARSSGNQGSISEAEILGLLQSMVKQRHDSILAYQNGNRHDLAEREKSEIEVIKEFLPKQMGSDALMSAVKLSIDAVGASSIKDMGKVMNELKTKYPGQMDFGRASALVKDLLN